MLTNYYFILGIPYTATSDEVKTAYRYKAKLYHPDVNKSPNAKLKFQIINEAYQILIDSDKRNAYDYKWKTRYGTSFHNRYNTTHYDGKTNYYRAYTSTGYKKKYDDKIERTFIDVFLFYFLILVALFSVFLGISHLIYKEWEGIDSLSGLLLGLWLIFLLLSGWKYIAKEK